MEQNLRGKLEKAETDLKSLTTIKPRLKLNAEKEGVKIGIKSDGKKYSVRNNRDRFFYPQEWMNFYDNLKESQKFSFQFMINTGSRINEAIHVRKGDISSDAEITRIMLRVTKIKARAGEKNPRPRTITISSQFARILKKELKDKPNNYQLGVCEDKNCEYCKSLKDNERGNLILSKPAIHLAMKKALKKSNINDWYMFSTHNVRKTFETWLMALNIDGLKIVAHLGHSMAVAAGHYVSADVFSFDEKNKMRLIIGDLYSR